MNIETRLPTTVLNNAKLWRDVDALKPEFFQLRTHALAQRDLHTREIYATVLAAILLVDGQVSENESRLFGMLVTSLQLGDIQGRLFQQASGLNKDGLREFFRMIGEAKAESCFVLDAFILCRIDGNLSEQPAQLLAEFLEFFQLPDHELEVLIFWASKILGFTFQGGVSDLVLKHLYLNWPSNIKIKPDEKIRVIDVLFSKGEFIRQKDDFLLCETKPVQIVGTWNVQINQNPERWNVKSSFSGLVYEILVNIEQCCKPSKEFKIASIVPLHMATLPWMEFIEESSLSKKDSQIGVKS